MILFMEILHGNIFFPKRFCKQILSTRAKITIGEKVKISTRGKFNFLVKYVLFAGI